MTDYDDDDHMRGNRGSRESSYSPTKLLGEQLLHLAVPFLPRDALAHNAVLRLHVVRMSVCPFVRLSV